MVDLRSSVAAPRLIFLLWPRSWGSRPRLNMYRPSGAPFGRVREEHKGAAQLVKRKQPQRHREGHRVFNRLGLVTGETRVVESRGVPKRHTKLPLCGALCALCVAVVQMNLTSMYSQCSHPPQLFNRRLTALMIFRVSTLAHAPG